MRGALFRDKGAFQELLLFQSHGRFVQLPWKYWITTSKNLLKFWNTLLWLLHPQDFVGTYKDDVPLTRIQSTFWAKASFYSVTFTCRGILKYCRCLIINCTELLQKLILTDFWRRYWQKRSTRAKTSVAVRFMLIRGKRLLEQLKHVFFLGDLTALILQQLS